MYKKFALLLEETNKTIYRVSADTGIATATLYDWRDGRSKPKVDKLAVLAKYFGVSVEYFLE
ncbi:helix-turn-helix domain-containing protein [Clostridium porci]|uniref:helix-turn-helix domain-containing protein n=1 Tax=Clostridium porci TaxID=2605778 RepID=UPI003A9424C2